MDEDVKPIRLNRHSFDAAVVRACQLRQVMEEVVADPLLIPGDGLDVYKRARELENSHDFLREGGRKESRHAGEKRACLAVPIALHPIPNWIQVTVGRC